MTYEQKLHILDSAGTKFGDNSQIDKAVEEMAELTKALMKYRYSNDDQGRFKEVVDEIADVGIMLEQLILIFDCRKEVEIAQEKKFRRLEELLNNGFTR